MQNKWTMGRQRDSGKASMQKLSPGEVRFGRRQASRKPASIRRESDIDITSPTRSIDVTAVLADGKAQAAAESSADKN